jgi:(1->4)-alpha-D-glucan 1-alpha-D-glucosylmutase
VDYDERRAVLDRTASLPAAEVWARHQDRGAPKLWLIRRALQVRRQHLDAFGPHGAYAPLEIGGAGADGLFGFVRANRVATVVPRLTLCRDRTDAVIALPAGRWEHALTGARLPDSRVPATALFADFPVALLFRLKDQR